MTNAFQTINYICELEAFQLAKEKSDAIKAKQAKQNDTYDSGETELAPHELLIDYPNSDLHERLRWKVICEQLAGGDYRAFVNLYYETDVIDVFEYMAVRNAIYAAQD